MNATPVRTSFDSVCPGMPPALHLSFRTLDELLASDQFMTARQDGGRLGDRSLFADLSDLDLACLYERGAAHLHDAAYCELHLRQITPWKIVSCPALELVR